MIRVEDAHQIVISHARDFGIVELPLELSVGRTLREPVLADRPMPPFDRVMMDGIAIRIDQFEKGQRAFPVAGMAAAGSPRQSLVDQKKCIEVMTGAILPANVDTVVRYEDLRIENGQATLLVDQLKRNQNIHFQGSDRKAGEVLVRPGVPLSAREIGVCAAVGKSNLKVSKLPKVLIISTGDELVRIDEEPLPHQIRRSNVYQIQAALRSRRLASETTHLNDRYDQIVNFLNKALREYEVILISGGVSMGKFDFLPDALEAVGVVKHFHRVAQKPGKPFWFGTHPEGATIFAFPGNPVSSFVCLCKYFFPWLEASLQQNPQPVQSASLSEDVITKPDLTHFLEVKLVFGANGQLVAEPVRGKGSGDLANLVRVDAWMELPTGTEICQKGDVFPLISF